MEGPQEYKYLKNPRTFHKMLYGDTYGRASRIQILKKKNPELSTKCYKVLEASCESDMPKFCDTRKGLQAILHDVQGAEGVKRKQLPVTMLLQMTETLTNKS